MIEIKKNLRDYLIKATSFTIEDDERDLVKEGIVSSLTMFSLIDYIEKKFKIEIDILSLTPENFNSIDNISKKIIQWTSK